MANGRGYKQAYDLRDLAAAEAVALLRTDPPKDFKDRASRAMAACSLVKAWEAASDRIRIMRGLPLPGSRKPEAKPRAANGGRKWTDIPPDKA